MVRFEYVSHILDPGFIAHFGYRSVQAFLFKIAILDLRKLGGVGGAKQAQKNPQVSLFNLIF